MRRAFLVCWWGLVLLLLLSGMAKAADVPVADVLRGPYAAPMVAAPPLADVLRGAYDAPVPVIPPLADVLRGTYNAPMLAMPPLADVLRGAYAMPVAVAAVPSTADVLRGAYVAPALPVMTFGAQPVPMADVLRGPYAETPPAPVPWYMRTDVMFSGFAVILLLIALVVDYLRHRHPPVAGGFQPPRPSHVH